MPGRGQATEVQSLDINPRRPRGGGVDQGDPCSRVRNSKPALIQIIRWTYIYRASSSFSCLIPLLPMCRVINHLHKFLPGPGAADRALLILTKLTTSWQIFQGWHGRSLLTRVEHTPQWPSQNYNPKNNPDGFRDHSNQLADEGGHASALFCLPVPTT